jgi:hypothetical protein
MVGQEKPMDKRIIEALRKSDEPVTPQEVAEEWITKLIF